MNIEQDFSTALAAQKKRNWVHCAAHSHHPWPNCVVDAHQEAASVALMQLDDKWSFIFNNLIPETQLLLADQLGAQDPKWITFAANTHELVTRLLSSWMGGEDRSARPLRIVTTDGEFHSMARQLAMWQKCRWIDWLQVPIAPLDSVHERLLDAVKPDDIVFMSTVLFETAQALVSGSSERSKSFLSLLAARSRFVILDQYHDLGARQESHFQSLPNNVARVGGAYKYLMSGEGACFLAMPKDHACVPMNTGWLAGFGDLQAGQKSRGDEQAHFRMMGSTLDPTGLFRLRASLQWMSFNDPQGAYRRRTIQLLERTFLEELGEFAVKQRWVQEFLTTPALERVRGPLENYHADRGAFLSIRFQNSELASRQVHQAKERGFLLDARGPYLRVGFGWINTMEHARALAQTLGSYRLE